MKSASSLVLVTVDCLRADHVGFMNYQRPTTPFLDSLALESTCFSNAIVAGAPTYYSFPGMLASRYPLALGREVLGLAQGEPSLASVLHDAGYATAGFNAGNPYLSKEFGYHQGFDVFRDFLEQKPDPAPQPSSSSKATPWNALASRWAGRLGLQGFYDELYFQYTHHLKTPEATSFDALRRFPAADAIVDGALAWLDSIGDTPFCLWLHLMDPHAPYYPAKAALELMKDDDINPSRALYLNQCWNRREAGVSRLRRHRDEIIRLYDAGIRWVDRQLQRLVDNLQSRGAWKNCLFALTSDHGEEFLEHGSRFHPQWTAKEELIKVPLLVRFPGKSGMKVSSVFSHIDLAPTLLESLAITIPIEFQGRSRRAALATGGHWDDPAVVDYTESANPIRREARLQPRVLCIREQNYKLVLRLGSGKEEIYDLVADPGEINGLKQLDCSVRRRLLQRARQHLNECGASVHLERRLRAVVRDLRAELSVPQ